MSEPRVLHRATHPPHGRVLTAPDPSLPNEEWTVRGGVAETAPGRFEWDQESAASGLSRYYRMESR